MTGDEIVGISSPDGDDITDSMDMNLSKLWEMVKNREAWRLQSMGLQKVGYN